MAFFGFERPWIFAQKAYSSAADAGAASIMAEHAHTGVKVSTAISRHPSREDEVVLVSSYRWPVRHIEGPSETSH